MYVKGKVANKRRQGLVITKVKAHICRIVLVGGPGQVVEPCQQDEH